MRLRYIQLLPLAMVFWWGTIPSWAIPREIIIQNPADYRQSPSSASLNFLKSLIGQLFNVSPQSPLLQEHFQRLIQNHPQKVLYQEIWDVVSYCHFLLERIYYFSDRMDAFLQKQVKGQAVVPEHWQDLQKEHLLEKTQIEKVADDFQQKLAGMAEKEILNELQNQKIQLAEYLKNFQKRNLKVIAQKRSDIYGKLYGPSVQVDAGAVQKVLHDFDGLQNRMKDLDQRVEDLSQKVTNLTMDVYERDQQLMEKGKRIQVLELQFAEVQERLKLVQKIIAEKDQRIEVLDRKIKDLQVNSLAYEKRLQEKEGINQVYRMKLADFVSELRLKEQELESLRQELRRSSFYSMNPILPK